MQIGRGSGRRLYRSQYFEGGRVLQAAQSAIDIALYDIKGKALGVPVYELLGGKQRDVIPTFATTGARRPTATMWSSRQRSSWRSAGTAIRLPGRARSTRTISSRASRSQRPPNGLIKVREALGDGGVLGIDYHTACRSPKPRASARSCRRGTLDFLEEPIRDETPEAYEALRKLTDVPFAIGEEFASKWQFLPYIERDIHQFNRIDLCNVGGFTEAMKVAGWSEAHYVDLMPHNPLGPICTAATIHFAAAVPNFAWLETRASPGELYHGFDNPEYLPRQPRLEGAHYRCQAMRPASASMSMRP
jgi:galactonate dehydratase